MPRKIMNNNNRKKQGGKKTNALVKAIAQAVGKQSNQMSGRGKYRPRGRNRNARDVGGILGSLAGMAIGSPEIGNLAGRALGGAVARRASGRGAYRTNDLVNGAAPASGVPTFGGDNPGRMRIKHKEYLTDVLKTDNVMFKNHAFYLNPGDELTFPWLSGIAANYAEYEFKGLIFTYCPVISQTSDGSTGTVILATNYNPDEATFTSKVEMMEFGGSVSARTTDLVVHGVECDPSKNSGSAIELVRVGPLKSGLDIKDYDLGIFQLALTGVGDAITDGTQVGELWVSYDIEFSKPRGRDIHGSDAFYATDVSCTAARPLGDVTQASSHNGIGCTVSYDASHSIVRLPDSYTGYLMITLLKASSGGSVFDDNSVTHGGYVEAWNCACDATTLVADNKFYGQTNLVSQGTWFFHVYKRSLSTGSNYFKLKCNTVVGAHIQTFLRITDVNGSIIGPYANSIEGITRSPDFA